MYRIVLYCILCHPRINFSSNEVAWGWSYSENIQELTLVRMKEEVIRFDSNEGGSENQYQYQIRSYTLLRRKYTSCITIWDVSVLRLRLRHLLLEKKIIMTFDSVKKKSNTKKRKTATRMYMSCIVVRQ